MITPAYLQKGDCMSIVATARSVDLDDLQDGIRAATNWGLQIEIGSSVGKIAHQFAGNDQERADDLQEQINNPKIKAIWCAKGGYGSVRLLSLIDFSPLLQHPKWIIGYSDVTALHCQLHTLGLVSLHGQMPVGISGKTLASASTLGHVLFGRKSHYTFNSHPLNQTGEVSGVVLGGNLSVLYSLCGSPSFPNFNNCILLLEDVDEYLYHIDRMMQNLKRNKVFENLIGIVIGGMTDMKDNAISFGLTAVQIINEYTKDMKIPVAFGAPFGHLEDNLALPLGKTIHMKVNKQKTDIQF